MKTHLHIDERPGTWIEVISDETGPAIMVTDDNKTRMARYTQKEGAKLGLAILEAHLHIDVREGPAMCTCKEWESRAIGINSLDQHRAHVAELIDQHMREREAEALEQLADELTKTRTHPDEWPRLLQQRAEAIREWM